MKTGTKISQNFSRTLIALPVILTTLLLAPLTSLSAAGKPNIVYILADDLGYGDVRTYNPQSKIPTPNIDRLASEGIRFTDAHAPDAVCTPTRYGLLTGRYAFRSRLKSGVLSPWGATLIEEGRLTVPALLRQHGYSTTCIGKWHLGWNWPTKDGQAPSSMDGIGNVDFYKPISGGPITRGFDSYFGVDLPNFPPYCFIENDRTVGTPSLASPQTKGGFNRPGPMVDGWNLTNILPEITTRAVRSIEDAAKSPAKPLFLYFPLTAPHYPIVPVAEFKGRSQAGDYGDFVAQVDWTVGEVLSALARTGLATNTLVIFTSDNGPEVAGEVGIGAYDRIKEFGHRSMDGLRGVKRDAWEGGHRVPFFARWPGRIPAGAVSDETICHVDLIATCAALLSAKLPPDAGEDSYNILPALLGQKLSKPIREATVLHSAKGSLALRQDDWVLIDARSGDGNHEPAWFKQERGYQTNQFAGELYNLRDDLGQTKNLYGEKPEMVLRLKTLLEKYKTEGRSAPLAKPQSAATPKAPGELQGWVDILPPSDLKGWYRVPVPPTGQLGREQWHVDVQKKVLVCDGDGGHDMLLFEKEIGDAIFYFEFRYTKIEGKTGYNSGAYVRNSRNGAIWHQAQFGDAKDGFLFGQTPGTEGQKKSFNLSKQVTDMRVKPAGEWNTMEVSAVGKILTLWVNGAVTCQFEDCGAEKGYLGLEGEGYRVEFRNLKVKALR